MAKRLVRLDVEPDSVDAVLLTHEHGDHARGAARFSARYGCEVWLTHGCAAALEAIGDRPERTREVDSHTGFSVGELAFEPFPVPHDAREPVQFVVSDGARRWALLTDAGHVTEHMVAMLNGCDALALECNHDVDMLKRGSYPASLKARILSRYGHLDNASAAGLLGRLNADGLQHLVAAHLSEENNSPQLARAALAGALGCETTWIGIADQSEGIGWRTLV